MSQARFGEHLSRLVNLSRHDVDEILEEQSSTRHRFGEIALSWGLCTPENVWQAWCDQLLSQVQKVDLVKLGIDSQAAAMIDRDTAVRLNAIPIRCMGTQLIVAVADSNTQQAAAELSLVTGKELRFVVADAEQLRYALSTYYPSNGAAA
jgi:hypothetical protein